MASEPRMPTCSAISPSSTATRSNPTPEPETLNRWQNEGNMTWWVR